jgi:hypothetical protein
MGKLGQLLVARGWITVQQLTRALQNQNAVGGRIGTCLLEMDVLGEDLLARSLSEQLGVPAAVIEDLRGIPDEVLRLIPEKLARRCRAVPFRVAGGRLDVAMQDPRNLVCQDEIAFACGRRVKVHVLHELRIFEALQRYYREECPSRYSLLLDRLNRARYLWAGKESGSRPGTPVAQLAQRAPGAPAMPDLRTMPGTSAAGPGGGPPGGYAMEDRTEVLSALSSEDLLSAEPRFQPSPLPEPELPPMPRRRSLFRSRGAGTPAPAGPESSGVRELPPLEELDLRGATATPRRRGKTEPAPAQTPAAPTPAEPPAAATPAEPAAATAATREPAPATPEPAPAPPPAIPPPATPQPAVPPPATAPAPLDLEATLTLGPPPAARPPRRPTGVTDVTGEREPDAPARRRPPEVPHERVAITEAERVELGLGEPPPTVPAGSPLEAPATIEEVEAAFAATTDSEEVGRILLGFLARGYRRVALFQATRDHVSAWMARGDGIDQEAFARYGVSFKEPSVFLNLRQGSRLHLGPLPPMATHRELALCWGGGLPRDCVVLPVRLMDRLVTVIYMDGGSRGLGGIDLEQMHRLTAATAAAFERCILSKKRGYAQS